MSLDENSFFRQHFPEIELVLATTQAAAKEVFASQKLIIDLLHIDADHSFEACLDDFRRYRPFLSSGAFVTFHDTALPGAGVQAVVEYLRTRGDCEVFDCPDIGVGTAIVRIVSDADLVPSRCRGGAAPR